jgi:NitT/TauT family transport system substrate-binding protein
VRPLLVLTLALSVGCAERRAAPPEPFVFAVSQNPPAALAHVAVAKGYFEAEGLSPTIERHAFGKLALGAVLSGKADLATCAETPLVLAALRGEPVAFVATIATTATGSAILGKRSAGVRAPADLAGKRVGVPLGTSSAFFLDTFLVRHRIARDTVRVVDLRPEAMAAALETGEVDAISLFWSPAMIAIQRQLGANGAVFFAEDVSWETHGVAARGEVLRQRPSVVQKAIHALVRAEAFVREHPEEARRIVGAAAGVEPAELDVMWPHYRMAVSLDQSLLVLMEEQARWAVAAGVAPVPAAPIDFGRALAPEPLLVVKPDAVRLIR